MWRHAIAFALLVLALGLAIKASVDRDSQWTPLVVAVVGFLFLWWAVEQ
jgi:hypothetical protein